MSFVFPFSTPRGGGAQVWSGRNSQGRYLFCLPTYHTWMSILQPNPNIEPLETPAWPTCFTREYRYLGKVSGVLARYLTYLGITVAIYPKASTRNIYTTYTTYPRSTQLSPFLPTFGIIPMPTAGCNPTSWVAQLTRLGSLLFYRMIIKCPLQEHTCPLHDRCPNGGRPASEKGCKRTVFTWPPIYDILQ